MNRRPVIGDCIRISGKRTDFVVVDTTIIHDEFYDVFLFSTIRETDVGKPNPKVTVWQTEGIGCDQYGTAIRQSDITFVRQSKLKKTVTYTVHDYR